MNIKTILVALGITLLLFLVTDCTFSAKENHIGKVVGRHYEPERIWYSTDDKGRMTTHRESEEFILIVRSEGQVIRVDTDMETYGSLKDNATIHYHCNIGCMTGMNWGYSAYEFEQRNKGW